RRVAAAAEGVIVKQQAKLIGVIKLPERLAQALKICLIIENAEEAGLTCVHQIGLAGGEHRFAHALLAGREDNTRLIAADTPDHDRNGPSLIRARGIVHGEAALRERDVDAAGALAVRALSPDQWKARLPREAARDLQHRLTRRALNRGPQILGTGAAIAAAVDVVAHAGAEIFLAHIRL